MSMRSHCSRTNTSLCLALAVTVLTLIISIPVQAATAVTTATIYKIGIYSGSAGGTGAYIYFSPAIPSLEGCSYTTGNEVWIDFSSPSEPTGKSLYATAVAGWLAGHSVTFEVSGCGDNGVLPLVYNIEIGP